MDPTSMVLSIGSVKRAGGGGGGGAGGGVVGVGGGAGLPPEEPPQPLNNRPVVKLASNHLNEYGIFTLQRSHGLFTVCL